MKRNANLNVSLFVVLPNLFEPHDTIFTKETAVAEIDDQRKRKMNDIGTELI